MIPLLMQGAGEKWVKFFAAVLRQRVEKTAVGREKILP
jgi:hypothetical protein